MRVKQLFLILLLGLVACVPSTTAPAPIAESTNPPTVATAVPPTATLLPATDEPVPTATTVPTTTPQPPTATATTTATAVPPNETPGTPLITVGRTAEGLYFRGNPEAPITMIDYSDFL